MVVLVGCHHSKNGRDTPVSLKQILWSFGIVLGAFALTVFGLYWWNVGPISSDHTAWSSFGSLLSGVFTIVGAGATVGTLLFLGKQNHDMQEVTKAQMATLTFERYINHRKLFLERLEELEVNCGGVFKFRDPTLLYSSIFPNNSLHNCELTVAPIFDQLGEGVNHIAKIYSKILATKSLLASSTVDSSSCVELIRLLNSLCYEEFSIFNISAEREGDVLFDYRVQSFNIYQLESFFEIATKISNMFFRFTNNKDVDAEDFYFDAQVWREAFIKSFYFSSQDKKLGVVRLIPCLNDLAWVRAAVDNMKEGDELLFSETKRQLDFRFGSFQRLEELSVESTYKYIVDLCLKDIKSKYDKMSGGEYFKTIGEVHNKLLRVSNALGSKK